MPPASPDTTLAWRSASSSEVLPWSTWPITVTTGERGSVSVESSTTSNRPSSTSDAATRLTVWPSSSAISCAVSASITSVILCIAPCFIKSRMTSTARSDMRLASSWILMASGMMTSRTSFSFGSFDWCPFRRWVRRRNDAIERSRTSSALSAVTRVRRPRCFAGAGLAVVLGAVAGRTMPPGPRRICRGPSSSSVMSAATPGARATGTAARATVAALAFLFRQPALFDVTDFGVGEGAGARAALILGQGAQHHARAAARRGRRGRGTGHRRLDRCRLGGGRLRRVGRFGCGCVATDAALAALFDHDLLGTAMAEALAHGARLDARLERQGLGRDTQCLVARRFRINHSAVPILLRCSYPHSRFMQVFLCKSLSAIRLRILGRFTDRLAVIRHPVSDQGMAARQERLARRAHEQGSMYHI